MCTRFQMNVRAWILFLCLAAPVWSADIYVDADAPGANNGSSWLDAFNDLQAGLTAALPGDTVKAAQGVYTPDPGAGSGSEGRTASFTLKPGVQLKGGYAGYSALSTWQGDDRDTQVYITVLSGDLDGNDAPIDPNNHAAVLGLLSAPSRADNSYHVVTLSNTSPDTLLDGFTITGGNANGQDDAWRQGGGIVARLASATIRDCTIMACSALNAGGGMYTHMGDPNVLGCAFVANYAEYSGSGMFNWGADPNISACVFEYNVGNWQCDGAGVYNYQSNAAMVDCIFRHNDSGKNGGGIYNYQSDLDLAGCVFSENAAGAKGGAIYSAGASRPLMTNCQFKRNTSGDKGGAVANQDSFPAFTACVFIGNESEEEGGAIYNRHSDPNILNCLFNGNEAGTYGGAVFCYDTEAVVINCTFAHNLALSGRAWACSTLSPPDSSSDVTITNSILWNGGAEIYNTDSSQIMVSYSHIKNGWPGKENKSSNPMFEDADGPDYIMGTEDDDLRLSAQSLCVDAGNNDAVPFGLFADLDGKPRFMDYAERSNTGNGIPPLVDRGAYEFGEIGGLNPPVAHAGADQTAFAPAGGQAEVQLDGSGSYDPDGDPLQYVWTWSAGQQQHQATGVKPTVQLPVGQHLIQLVVFDGVFYSAPDTVLTTVIQGKNQPPVANAGPDQTVSASAGGLAHVGLDGSGSYDPDGDPLHYIWYWMVGNLPYQTSGVNPVIQLPRGQHVITLVAHDAKVYSEPDTVAITVGQADHRPVANAGPDQTVLAPVSGQATVVLDGSGSYSPYGGTLQYTWSWTVGGWSYQTTGVNPAIQLPIGQHIVTLIVFDGPHYSAPDTVLITVTQENLPPIADAGSDQATSTAPGELTHVTLNGSGSRDPEGAPLRFTWSWTIGSQAYQAQGMFPVIQLPAGDRTIQLVVFDGLHYSAPDDVNVFVDVLYEATLSLSPHDVSRHDTSEYISATVQLTNVLASEVDLTVPLALHASGAEALDQYATHSNDNGTIITTVFATFAEEDVLSVIPQDGVVPLTVWGQLISGEAFHGTDTVVLTH